MKKLLVLMLLGVLFVPMNGSAKADEVLYCQTELAPGLAQREDGTWREGSFERKRFTIKVVGDFEEVIGFGNDEPVKCYNPFRRSPNRIMFQEMSGNVYFFDKSSLRFLFSKASVSTYLKPDTPVLYAGTCVKF